MKLCFVSVNGPREPYLLDESRRYAAIDCLVQHGNCSCSCSCIAQPSVDRRAIELDHLHTALKLRMSGTSPPFHHMSQIRRQHCETVPSLLTGRTIFTEARGRLVCKMRR
jgi:hypothetical protein